jgi:hypothetical protein
VLATDWSEACQPCNFFFCLAAAGLSDSSGQKRKWVRQVLHTNRTMGRIFNFTRPLRTTTARQAFLAGVKCDNDREKGSRFARPVYSTKTLSSVPITNTLIKLFRRYLEEIKLPTRALRSAEEVL